MDKTIKAILLTNNQIIVSQIDEVPPFTLTSEGMLESWMMTATRDEEFMISSDKIMTIATPTPTLVEKYEDLTK